MWRQVRRRLVKRLQNVGWVYYTNNFYIDGVAGVTVPAPTTPLEFVAITPMNCARVQDFREAALASEYAAKLARGEAGYFAVSAGGMVGSIWATVNSSDGPVVARGHVRLVPGEALIHDIVTGEKFRGLGIGAFMVGRISTALFERYGVNRIVIDVNVNNRPSLRMMAKAGLQARDAALSVSAFGTLVMEVRLAPRVVP